MSLFLSRSSWVTRGYRQPAAELLELVEESRRAEGPVVEGLQRGEHCRVLFHQLVVVEGLQVSPRDLREDLEGEDVLESEQFLFFG